MFLVYHIHRASDLERSYTFSTKKIFFHKKQFFPLTIFRQHPHKLSSKGEMLDSGHVWTKFFRVEKSEEKSQIIQIKDIGIVFVKKPTIEESLKHRRNEKESDPTKGEIIQIVTIKIEILRCQKNHFLWKIGVFIPLIFLQMQPNYFNYFVINFNIFYFFFKYFSIIHNFILFSRRMG